MSATLLKRPLPKIQTITPNGRPAWPLFVVAGVEGSGKSWKAVEMSGSPLVGKTYWVEYGEDTAQEYGAVPGANYEIVPVGDGSYLAVLDAVRWACAQPLVDGKPNLIVFDSGSRLWELLTDEQQIIANRRAVKKAERGRRAMPREDEDTSITPDQWNVAKDRWQTLANLLRQHNGPAIMLCRLAETNVMKNGEPTGDKVWSMAAHKSLPFDAQVIVQMRQPYPEGKGRGTLVKLRSARAEITHEVDLREWTVAAVLDRMGFTAETAKVAESSYVEPNAAAYEAEYDATRAGGPQGEDPAPSVEKVTEAIAQAKGAPDPGQALVRAAGWFGREALSAVTLDTRQGPTPADKVFDGLIAFYLKAQEPAQNGAQEPARNGEPAQSNAQSNAQNGAQSNAQEPAQNGAQEEHPAKRAADETVARSQARRSSKERMQDRLVEEATYYADVLTVDLADYLAVVVEEQRKQSVEEVPPTALGRWLVAQRPKVVEGLIEQGRASEADRLRRIGDASPIVVTDMFEDGPAQENAQSNAQENAQSNAQENAQSK